MGFHDACYYLWLFSKALGQTFHFRSDSQHRNRHSSCIMQSNNLMHLLCCCLLWTLPCATPQHRSVHQYLSLQQRLTLKLYHHNWSICLLTVWPVCSVHPYHCPPKNLRPVRRAEHIKDAVKRLSGGEASDRTLGCLCRFR